jgi:hypothetical protein
VGISQKRVIQKAVWDAQLVVLEAISNFFCDAPEIAYGYLARVIIVEELERAPNLFHWVTRQYPFRHCK